MMSWYGIFWKKREGQLCYYYFYREKTCEDRVSFIVQRKQKWTINVSSPSKTNFFLMNTRVNDTNSGTFRSCKNKGLFVKDCLKP